MSISVILWALSGIAIFAVGLGLLSYSVFHNQDASPYPLIALFSSWLVICISVWVILIGVFGWHLFGISIPRHANRDFIPHGLVRVLPDGRENIDWSLVLCIVRLSQNPSAKSSGSAEQARPQYEPSRKSIGWVFFSEPPFPTRPQTGPSGLAALLCVLPGFLTSAAGFLLLFSPYRRPNLGAFLFLFGIAVMFASLTLLSLTQLRLSSINSLQYAVSDVGLSDGPPRIDPDLADGDKSTLSAAGGLLGLLEQHAVDYQYCSSFILGRRNHNA